MTTYQRLYDKSVVYTQHTSNELYFEQIKKFKRHQRKICRPQPDLLFNISMLNMLIYVFIKVKLPNRKTHFVKYEYYHVEEAFVAKNNKYSLSFGIWLHLEVIFILILLVFITSSMLKFNKYCYAEAHYLSLEDYQGARHVDFHPHNIYKPCQHEFRDNSENCAVFSEVVIIGSAISFESTTSQNRYYYFANIRVSSVLKTPRYMIYPIRPSHIIKVGIFNVHEDKAVCMPNISIFKNYFFYLNRPLWNGLSKIAQLPMDYTDTRLRNIREALYGEDKDLTITHLSPQEKLEVTENENLKLECRAEGKPKPTISWLFQGKSIIQSFIETSPDQKLSSIELLNLTLMNQGNYTCLAKNAFGSIHRSVEIIVNKKPVIHTTTTEPPHPCHNYCKNGSCYIEGGLPRCSCPSRFHGQRCERVFQDKVANQLSDRQQEDATKAVSQESFQDVPIYRNDSLRLGNSFNHLCNDCDSSLNRMFFFSLVSFIGIVFISLFAFIIFKKRLRLLCKRYICNQSSEMNSNFSTIEVNGNQFIKSVPREFYTLVNSSVAHVQDPYFLTPQTYRQDILNNSHTRTLNYNHLYGSKNNDISSFVMASNDPLSITHYKPHHHYDPTYQTSIVHPTLNLNNQTEHQFTNNQQE